MASSIKRKEILSKFDIQKLYGSSCYDAKSLEELSIKLNGDNERNTYVLNKLIQQIQLFPFLKYLEIYFGYQNIIDIGTFNIIFKSISTLKQLQKLQLTFDYQSVAITTLQDFQQISQIQKQIPQLDELVLILCKDTLIDFENSNNIVSLFISNQTQIKTLKLELNSNNLKNTFMINLTKQLCKFTQLEKLDITLQDSGIPLDLQQIIQNLFVLNLSSLSITVERCLVQKNESSFFIIDNQVQSQLKDLYIRFVEIENIGNIITSILSQVNSFENLINFDFYLEKIQGLENLEIEKQNFKDTLPLSHLIKINVEILNSIFSCSLISYIFNKIFYDDQQLNIFWNNCQINVKNSQIGNKNQTFIYESFKNADFQNQILGIFTKQNQQFKKQQEEKEGELDFSQLSLSNNIISTQQLNIRLDINQETMNNLAVFLDSINTISLQKFQLELNNYQNQLVQTDQLVKSLTKLVEQLNYTEFDGLFYFTYYSYLQEIKDKTNKFNILVNNSNFTFTIINQLIRNLQGQNINVKTKLIMDELRFDKLCSKFDNFQQDKTSMQKQQLSDHFDCLNFQNIKKELELGTDFDFDKLKYQKDISIEILKINCCKNFQLSNVLQRFTNIESLDIAMKESEEIELDPSIITQERSVTSAARINVTNNNIVAMFGVSDGASEIWSDPTIFRMYAVQQILQISNNTDTGQEKRQLISHNKTMKTCDEKDIGIPSVKPYFSKLNMKDLYCLEQGQDIYIEGDYDAQSFAQVFVYVEKCTNGTVPNIICKPIDVIDQKLKLSKIQMFLSNTIVDPLNHENPFSSKGMNLYTQTSSSFPKEVQLYFTNQYIQDDIGFMFREIKQKHSFIFTIQQETSFFSNYNVLARILIRLQKQKENLMQRRYQKFQDIVAQIGGLMKLLTTIGSIITYRFTSLYLYKAIGDEILIYDDTNIKKFKGEKVSPKNQKKKIKKNESQKQIKNEIINSEKILSKNDLLQIRSLSSFEQNEQKNDNFIQANNNNVQCKQIQLKKIEFPQQSNQINLSEIILRKSKLLLSTIEQQNVFKVIKNKIQYNFFDYFKQLFAPFLQNEDYRAKLVQKGIQTIEKQLDIIFILNKLNEIDKLKTIILDQDQLKVFNNIPKPVISDAQFFQNENKTKEQNNQILTQNLKQQTENQIYDEAQSQKSESSKAEDAIQGLQKIINNDKLTKIDKALIQIIDPNILSNEMIQSQNNLPKIKKIDLSIKSQDVSVFADFQECIDEKISNQSPDSVKRLKINNNYQINPPAMISLNTLNTHKDAANCAKKNKNQPDSTE
ncbi:hypothetical protein ABPG74_012871 [Tetrahymena malaccensis]